MKRFLCCGLFCVLASVILAQENRLGWEVYAAPQYYLSHNNFNRFDVSVDGGSGMLFGASLNYQLDEIIGLEFGLAFGDRTYDTNASLRLSTVQDTFTLRVEEELKLQSLQIPLGIVLNFPGAWYTKGLAVVEPYIRQTRNRKIIANPTNEPVDDLSKDISGLPMMLQISFGKRFFLQNPSDDGRAIYLAVEPMVQYHFRNVEIPIGQEINEANLGIRLGVGWR